MPNNNIETNIARLLSYVAADCECSRCSHYRYIAEPFLYDKPFTPVKGNSHDSYTKSDQS